MLSSAIEVLIKSFSALTSRSLIEVYWVEIIPLTQYSHYRSVQPYLYSSNLYHRHMSHSHLLLCDLDPEKRRANNLNTIQSRKAVLIQVRNTRANTCCRITNRVCPLHSIETTCDLSIKKPRQSFIANSALQWRAHIESTINTLLSLHRYQTNPLNCSNAVHNCREVSSILSPKQVLGTSITLASKLCSMHSRTLLICYDSDKSNYALILREIGRI